MNDIYIRIGKRLKDARERLKYSQVEVSKITEGEISDQMLSLYELGKRTPDLSKLEQLADIYGISLLNLIGVTKERGKELDISELTLEYKRTMIDLYNRFKKEKPIEEREHAPPGKEKGGRKHQASS